MKKFFSNATTKRCKWIEKAESVSISLTFSLFRRFPSVWPANKTWPLNFDHIFGVVHFQFVWDGWLHCALSWVRLQAGHKIRSARFVVIMAMNFEPNSNCDDCLCWFVWYAVVNPFVFHDFDGHVLVRLFPYWYYLYYYFPPQYSPEYHDQRFHSAYTLAFPYQLAVVVHKNSCCLNLYGFIFVQNSN